MSDARSATAVFDQEFLPIRAKILEVGASLDRLDRAAGAANNDPRWHAIQAAISTLQLPIDDRAEQIQLIFSRPYEDGWRREFQMTNDE
jgi:hypothetical protein